MLEENTDDNKTDLLADAATVEETDAKPDGLPDKFWDAKTQSVRVEALVKSYLALEKKLSSQGLSDEDMRARYLQLAGMPETPDGYQVTIRDNLFEPDQDLHGRLHAKGFTPEQVQEVYDLAVDKMIPLILEMASEFQAERELERLVSHFGGDDQWREISRQMLAFGKKNLPPKVLEGMSSSYEGIMALYAMMQSKEPTVMDGSGMRDASAAMDLESMMRDPKYWRDKDPAFIAKVTEGFKNMYGA